MASTAPFDEEAVLGTACRLLQVAGNRPAAHLLAKAQGLFTIDEGSHSADVEVYSLRLAIPAALYGRLAEGMREEHEEAIGAALRDVMRSLEGYALVRVLIVPKLVSADDWRSQILADQELPDGRDLPIFEFWSRSASPYEILGVRRDATDEQLATARKRLLGICHPDRNQARKDAAHEATIRVNEAYDAIVAERADPSSGSPF